MPIAAGPRSRASAACVGATPPRPRRSGGRRPPTTTAATKIRPTTTPAGSPPGRTGLDPGSSTFAGRATPSLPGTEDGVTADATPPDPRLAVDLDPLQGGSAIRAAAAPRARAARPPRGPRTPPPPPPPPPPGPRPSTTRASPAVAPPLMADPFDLLI